MSNDELKARMAPEVLAMEKLIRAGREELKAREIARNTVTQAEWITQWAILFKREYQEAFLQNKPVPDAFLNARDRYPKRFDMAAPIVITMPDGSVDFIPPMLTPLNPKFSAESIIAMTNALERERTNRSPFSATEVVSAISAVSSELSEKNFKDDPESMRRKRAIHLARGMIRNAHKHIEAAKEQRLANSRYNGVERIEDTDDDDDIEVF